VKKPSKPGPRRQIAFGVTVDIAQTYPELVRKVRARIKAGKPAKFVATVQAPCPLCLYCAERPARVLTELPGFTDRAPLSVWCSIECAARGALCWADQFPRIVCPECGRQRVFQSLDLGCICTPRKAKQREAR
jgi:hypothetical protein